eukprot:scaffold164758_cov35-Cyclotella_meneghiniana.AAC.2
MARLRRLRRLREWQQSTVWRLLRRCVKRQRHQRKDKYVGAVALGCGVVLLGCGVDRGTAMAIFVVVRSLASSGDGGRDTRRRVTREVKSR